jgi:HlyD family secretion protein
LTKGLKILAEIPEADVAQIKINQEVEIMSNTYPGKVFTGKVRLISPEAVRNQNVTLFQVRVDLETGQDQLKSGMNVALTFIGQEIKNAVVVPSVAVLTKNSQEGVLISDHKNKPKFQPVTIGSVIGNQTQIINGVKVGERVFIDDVSKN